MASVLDMAVLAADVHLSHFGTPNKISVPCDAADTFYAGAFIWGKAAGKATCAPSAGDRVIGICTRQYVTTAADQLIDIYVDGLFQLPTLTNVTVADLGSVLVFDVSAAVSDNPTDIVSSEDITLADNDACVGRLVSWLDGLPVLNMTGLVGAIYNATTNAYWKL